MNIIPRKKRQSLRPGSVKKDSLSTGGPPAIILISVVTALAALLMFFSLGKKSLWVDESFVFALAQQDLATLWKVLLRGEVNMGLYYALQHWWVNLGQSEFALRSLSAVFALATVPAAYAIGSYTFGKKVGVVCALLLTVNTFFIRYAQEARGYSLALLLVTLSSYFFLKITRHPSRKLWIGYIFCSALSVYAHFYAFLVLIGHAISLAFWRRRDLQWRGLAVCGVAIVLLLIPLGLFIVLSPGIGPDWIPQPNLRSIVKLFRLLAGGSWPLLTAYFVCCLISFIYAVKSWIDPSKSLSSRHYGFFLIWLFVPIFISFFYSLIDPLFWYRYFIICLVPLVILAALGLSCLPDRRIFKTALLIFLILSGLSLSVWYKAPDKEGGEDWRLATDYVLSVARAGDTAVFQPPLASYPFYYYLHISGEIPDTLFHSTKRYVTEKFSTGKWPDYDDKFFEDLPSRHDRVWLIARNISKHAQTKYIFDSLRSNYNAANSRKFKKITVMLYQKTTHKPP